MDNDPRHKVGDTVWIYNGAPNNKRFSGIVIKVYPNGEGLPGWKLTHYIIEFSGPDKWLELRDELSTYATENEPFLWWWKFKKRWFAE